MSDLQQILARSQTDYDFYLAVLTNPDQALASYTLSKSERAALTGERMALWNLLREMEPVEPNGGPPPGPPPPGPPPPGPPPPPPGPPPPGPPPPPPGPPPPGPPPPPPGIGVVITGHHDWFNVFQQREDFLIDEIVADPAVIAAVQTIRTAENSGQRIGAVNQLMERIG